MKKIKFVFSSGLGNQLFMYALYLYIERKYPDVELKPSLFPYEYLNPHNGFELHKLFNDEKIITAFNKLRRKTDSSVSTEPFFKKYMRIICNKMSGYRNVTDRMICGVDDLTKTIDSIAKMQFVGFFQIPDFAKEALELMKDKLKPINWGDRNEILLDEISSRISCSIHVRRGDYVGNPYFDIINYEQYYAQAISYIKRRNPNVVFVLFSDDIAWASKMLNLASEDLKICDWNKGEDSYLDLFLMSRCNHNILANSSFSYWGGVINSYENKIVIAPSLWAKGLKSERITQPDWILI